MSSPRFSGSMTRRGQSVKKGTSGDRSHDIELQINSPRSSSACDSPSARSPASEAAAVEEAGERWQGNQQRNVRFRERRKIGNLLFLVFCSVCLVIGIVRISDGGWLGFNGIGERRGDYQVSLWFW